jgi:FKBP-type peptidyl-prolyl cis-trans isomerase
VKTKSGITVDTVSAGLEGAEEAHPGSNVNIHYTGRVKGGPPFAGSNRRDGFRFELGAGQVIAGWDEGIVGMKVGEVRKLVVPPQLAYGAEGFAPAIPPNATLEFEIELLAIEASGDR